MQLVWHNLPAGNMSKKNETESADQDTNPEIIIKQHRRRAQWIEGRRIMGEGSLILTNRRLLFLHRIESSPQVTESIKKLADAPMETVLNHALTLHNHNFQIPLISIVQAGIGDFTGFPFPHFCLNIVHLKGKKASPQTVSFLFKKNTPGIFFSPQIIIDLNWKKAIEQAIWKSSPPEH